MRSSTTAGPIFLYDPWVPGVLPCRAEILTRCLQSSRQMCRLRPKVGFILFAIRVIWPLLGARHGDRRAARIEGALHRTRCVLSRWVGAAPCSTRCHSCGPGRRSRPPTQSSLCWCGRPSVGAAVPVLVRPSQVATVPLANLRANSQWAVVVTRPVLAFVTHSALQPGPPETWSSNFRRNKAANHAKKSTDLRAPKNPP